MRLLLVSGSLREGSLNTALVQAAGELSPGHVTCELSCAWQHLPLYDGDLDGPEPGDEVQAWREELRVADALLIATPEYNGSVPGGLKNAVDWASRPRESAPLHGLPVCVIGTSPGQYGAIWAQNDLRRILGIAGARVVGEGVAVPNGHTRFDAAGRLVDATTRRRLRRAVDELVAQAAPVALTS